MQDRKTTQDPWLASLDTGPSHLDGLSVRQTAAVVARIEARGERDEIARLRRDGFAETLAELRTDEPDLEPGEAEAWARQINADRIADAECRLADFEDKAARGERHYGAAGLQALERRLTTTLRARRRRLAGRPPGRRIGASRSAHRRAHGRPRSRRRRATRSSARSGDSGDGGPGEVDEDGGARPRRWAP